MKLQTKIALKPAENQIDYQSRLLLLGSCFAANIGEKLAYYKFQSVQNPLGILFHPLAIEKLIARAITKDWFREDEVFFLNERWHCFDAHSALSDPSKEQLILKLNAALEETYWQISEATEIIITFGTAWVYRRAKTKAVVANCHKVAQKEFSKEILSVEDIQTSIEKIIEMLLSLNPKLNIILTVSPVRHLKDGFVENQRSKAHLIAAIHRTLDNANMAARMSYFPSYEIIMDELRDYRFYEADMVHPNQVALQYIWERFEEVCITTHAQEVMEKVEVVQKGLLHRPFNPESDEHKSFVQSLEKKIMYLQQEYPHMKFDA